MIEWKKILSFKWYAGFATMLAGVCIYTMTIGWSYWHTQPEKWSPGNKDRTQNRNGYYHK